MDHPGKSYIPNSSGPGAPPPPAWETKAVKTAQCAVNESQKYSLAGLLGLNHSAVGTALLGNSAAGVLDLALKLADKGTSGAELAGDVALSGAPFAKGVAGDGIAGTVQKQAVPGAYRYVAGAGQELTTIGPEAEEAAAQAAAETAAAGAAASTVLGAKMAADLTTLALATAWCITQ